MKKSDTVVSLCKGKKVMRNALLFV